MLKNFAIFVKIIAYEGSERNPVMSRVLLTHEIMCRCQVFPQTLQTFGSEILFQFLVHGWLHVFSECCYHPQTPLPTQFEEKLLA